MPVALHSSKTHAVIDAEAGSTQQLHIPISAQVLYTSGTVWCCLHQKLKLPFSIAHDTTTRGQCMIRVRFQQAAYPGTGLRPELYIGAVTKLHDIPYQRQQSEFILPHA